MNSHSMSTTNFHKRYRFAIIFVQFFRNQFYYFGISVFINEFHLLDISIKIKCILL